MPHATLVDHRGTVVVTEDGNGRIRIEEWTSEQVYIRHVSAERAATLIPILLDQGYAIRDPQHLLDFIEALSEPYTSIAAMDADSAGYPGQFVPALGTPLGDGHRRYLDAMQDWLAEHELYDIPLD